MVALVNMLLAGCSVPASGPVGPIELVDSGMDTDVAGSEDTGASSSAGVVSVTVSSPGLELFFPPSGWTDLEAIDVRGRVDGDVQYVLVESAVDSRLVFPDADRRFVAAGVELGAGLSIDLTIEAVGVLGFTAEEHVRLQRGVGPPPGWQVSGLAFDRSGERLLVWDTDEPGDSRVSRLAREMSRPRWTSGRARTLRGEWATTPRTTSSSSG